MEDIFTIVDGEDAILESALPARAVSILYLIGDTGSCLPLILDTLHFVIHAEHHMAHGVLIIFIVVLIVVRIVQIRVDGIIVEIFIFQIIVRPIHLGWACSSGFLVCNPTVPSGFPERQHEAATFHFLGPCGDLGMDDVVNINAAHLNRAAVGAALHQDTLKTVARPVYLGCGEAIRRGAVRLLLLLLLLQLLLLLHSLLHLIGKPLAILLRVYLLLIHLLLVHLLLGLPWTLWLLRLLIRVHLRGQSALDGTDGRSGPHPILALKSLGGALGGHLAASGIGIGVGQPRASSARLLLDDRVILKSRLTFDGYAVAVWLGISRVRDGLRGGLGAQSGLGVVGSGLLGC